MLKLLLPAIFCCCVFSGFTQTIQLSGKIVDGMDEATSLPYASIHLIGKDKGTISDENGQFVLIVDEDDLIRFSYPGYEEIKLFAGEVMELKGQVALNVRQLREVVITAFKWEPYFHPHGPCCPRETLVQIDFLATWDYFPNPTKEVVYVTSTMEGRINVFSIDQKLVLTQKTTGEQTRIELAGQSPGVYLLVFENDGFSKTIGQLVLID